MSHLLRVGIIHHNEIIEEKKFTSETVTIGKTIHNTFSFEKSDLPDQFVLFKMTSRRCFINLRPDFQGSLFINDETIPFETVELMEDAEVKGEIVSLRFTKNCRGKLIFGDYSILFEYIPRVRIVPERTVTFEDRGKIIDKIPYPFLIIFLFLIVLVAGPIVFLDVWWRDKGQFIMGMESHSGQILNEINSYSDEGEEMPGFGKSMLNECIDGLGGAFHDGVMGSRGSSKPGRITLENPATPPGFLKEKKNGKAILWLIGSTTGMDSLRINDYIARKLIK